MSNSGQNSTQGQKKEMQVCVTRNEKGYDVVRLDTSSIVFWSNNYDDVVKYLNRSSYMIRTDGVFLNGRFVVKGNGVGYEHVC